MINILFGGNEKVFDGIMLCLMSMCKHTKRTLNIFILTADVTELNPKFTPITKEQCNLLNKYIQSFNQNNKITLIKLGNEFNNWIMQSQNKLSYYTPFSFLRLFADKIDLPDKIIYFDTDIMINGDIGSLFDIDIGDYEFGAVLDKGGQIFINANYFNSGMLLMNLPKIKESNLLEKVKEVCVSKKMPFPDQDALNKLAKNVLYLPRKFNEQGKLKPDTIVQHFCKRIKWTPFPHTINIKPWEIEKVQKAYKIHAYDDIFEKYINLKNNPH